MPGHDRYHFELCLTKDKYMVVQIYEHLSISSAFVFPKRKRKKIAISGATTAEIKWVVAVITICEI